MQNFFTPDVDRGTYERVIGVLAAQMGIPAAQFVSQYKVMPSVLKMAAYLNPGLSSYVISPRKGVDQNAPGNTTLLDYNDFFAVSGLGLRLGRAAYAAGLYSNQGNYPVLTYADPAFFNGSGTAVGSEAASLQTLVNGNTSIQVNQDTMMDGILNQELMFNPEATYTASPLAYPRFGGSDGERGIFPLTPQLILDASADNSVQVNLATGAKLNIDGAISTGTTDSGIRNILYVIMYGWKIKNLAGSGNAICGKV